MHLSRRHLRICEVHLVPVVLLISLALGCGKSQDEPSANRERPKPSVKDPHAPPLPAKLTGTLVQQLFAYPEILIAEPRRPTSTDLAQVSRRLLWVRGFRAQKDRYRPLTVYACAGRCQGKLLRFPGTRCRPAGSGQRLKICEVGFFLGGRGAYVKIPSPGRRYEILVLVELPTADVQVSSGTRAYFRSWDPNSQLLALARGVSAALFSPPAK